MIDYERKVNCVRGREDARALCGWWVILVTRTSSLTESIIQMSNFVIVGVRMALAIEMNWRLRLSKSTTLGTNNSTQNGMGWLCIDVDMFLFLPQRLPQYSLLESPQQSVPYHTDIFEDSHGGNLKVTTAPLHPPHKRHVLRFCHPLSAYLRPPLCPLHVESPKHLRFENDTGSRRTKVRMKLET